MNTTAKEQTERIVSVLRALNASMQLSDCMEDAEIIGRSFRLYEICLDYLRRQNVAFIYDEDQSMYILLSRESI
ncbi:hypothetical protein EPA93_29430 [Ktedonosporobacter rubrisoli]|uniref:Uncharacterized protein n=1 Tax=Ktedonosporobacter rubrisoli TaxID=2509675 RepID=A0A4P6JWZ3_KTERU|nr:hypothetical protein [Ktedonosporobacter rubrisoli]QBD79880.1 hypothetical protein EPA93_29430 [Ktedonosporobacter rubrisoli]